MKLYPLSIRDERVRDYLPVTRILAGADAVHAEVLAGNPECQFHLGVPDCSRCLLRPGGWLLLDFGCELQGGVRIISQSPARLRLRFGESVSEAMGSPNQDHAIHDADLVVPAMGSLEYGSTAFRFVRIDSLESEASAELLNVLAVATYRDLEWTGSFQSSDERLNRIWRTGAYTVLLNMQDYIYDGVKRDRMVWMGDLNPEIRTILAVFSDHSLIRKTLDYIRSHTPLPGWMNGMPSYSLWYVITQEEYFMHTGDEAYLRELWAYVAPLMRELDRLIAPDGAEILPPPRLLDWPNFDNPEGTHAGLQGLMTWGFSAARRMAVRLGEDTSELDQSLARLRRHIPPCGTCKAAAAMQILGGLANPVAVLQRNPFEGISTFYGGYVLCPQPTQKALEVIRRYWGGMLDAGATTFWEDFDLAWLENSSRIDEFPIPGKRDIHGDFGRYCYKGLRHSLCHGWSSGPTSFLSRRVLGIRFLEPGGRRIAVLPDLGDLEYVRGSYPTPCGAVSVEADASGKVSVSAPAGVEVQEGLPSRASQEGPAMRWRNEASVRRAY